MTKKEIKTLIHRGGIPELQRVKINCLTEAYLKLQSLVDTPGKYDVKLTIESATNYTKMALQLEEVLRKPF
jgi:hypothetical protein